MSNMPNEHSHIRPLGRRLLMVEDHRDVLRAMCRLLAQDGYEVLPAVSVAEAFDQLDLRPDIIVTDLLLPDGDGLDVLRRARRRDYGWPPVAFYTAAGDERLLEVAAACPDAIFRKPLDLGALRAWVKSKSESIVAATPTPKNPGSQQC